MENLIEQGLLGIVTGVVTTAILFLAKSTWDAKLKPFLQELRYSGVKVDGKWEGYGSDEEGSWRTEMFLFLTQSALYLAGTFVLKHRNPINQFEIHFKVSGHIWEGYLVLNFTPIDRRITSYATAMLKVSGGGVGLAGQLAYRDVNKEHVTAEPVSLGRSAA